MASLLKYKSLKQLGIYTIIVFLLSMSVLLFYKFVGGSDDNYVKNIRAKVGQPIVIDLPGRVSIEFRWQINQEKSKGLELLDITHIGWIYPKDEGQRTRTSRFGTPRTAKFYLQPKAPGVIQLALEYKRRGIVDDIPQRSRDFTIHVDP